MFMMSDSSAFQAKCDKAVLTLMSHTSTPPSQGSSTDTSSDTASTISSHENFQNESAMWAGQPRPEMAAVMETSTAHNIDTRVRDLEASKAELNKSWLELEMLRSSGVPTVTVNPPISDALHDASVDMRA